MQGTGYLSPEGSCRFGIKIHSSIYENYPALSHQDLSELLGVAIDRGTLHELRKLFSVV